MKIKKITPGKFISTADFEVPDTHAYYMGNGIVSHNTSIYQDASASFLPIYDAFFAEDNNNGTMKVSARFLTQNPIGYGKNFAKFNAKEIIDVCQAVQKFTDTGCSMELIFDQNNPEFKAKDLYDAIHHAWNQKLKSIYYIRSIKKNEKLEKQEADCVACAG